MLKRWVSRGILFFVLSILHCVCSGSVLILYDAVGDTNWVGYLNSVFLGNLIGHFDTDYTIEPIEQYKKGELNQYDTTFYMGSYYNNVLPKTFIDDAINTTRTLVWFRYNFAQFEQAIPNFSTLYGFRVQNIDSSGYDTIIYKKTQLSKSLLDPYLGLIKIDNPLQATASALALQTRTGNTTPYIVHSHHLWYVADIPFTYLSENDRYLAFADLLYDMLAVPAVPEQKRALLRLEDVHPGYDTTVLKSIADYLYAQHVPFAISVIPAYADPLGYYKEGVPHRIMLTEAPEFVKTLKYMESRGGTIILHGYTHQYSEAPNPLTGVSGDDYEFFRVEQDLITAEITTFQPVDEDSDAWVDERVTAARLLLKQSNLSAAIWETPHYLASILDNRYFAKNFAATIGRVHYFEPSNTMHHAEQFFPYVIKKDYYGLKIIPENLGFVEPDNSLGLAVRTVDEIVLSAQKNLVVRDAWASMFYHPYLGLSYIQQLIPAIKALGYEFVTVSPDLR